MDSETYQRQKAYAGELQPSMLRRCVDHDYNGRCMYMVTMVIEGRRPLFGQVIGLCDAEPGTESAPKTMLTELGRRVQSHFLSISERHPEIEIVALQMMPDHLHGIIYVTKQMEAHLGQAISGFKSGCNKDYRELILGEVQSCQEVHSCQEVQSCQNVQSCQEIHSCQNVQSCQEVQSCREVQSVVALPQQTKPRPPRSAYDRKHGLLFASGYNDRILLRDGQLERWIKYLADNPRRLLMKRAHSEWLSPHFNIQAGGYAFSAIGNLNLLKAPKRLQVRISRRCSPAQVEEEVARFMKEAKSGAILVSPSISPGEKAVMRAAFDAGLPMIVLVENGFTPLTKPQGEQFDACASGRLLLLAPWAHHNDKHKITGMQCQSLNLMATAICQLGDTPKDREVSAKRYI